MMAGSVAAVLSRNRSHEWSVERGNGRVRLLFGRTDALEVKG